MRQQSPPAHRLGAVVITAAALLASGCCETYKCGTPLADIRVRDKSGADLAAALVQGEGLIAERYCTREGPCRFRINGVEATAMVSAPGYKPVMVPLQRKQDECGNGLTQQVDVVLAPDTGAEQSVSQVTAALGCGR
jgi:hypothetical protein